MIRGVAHVCFIVSDLERSIEFYRDKLEMREAFDFVDEQGERFGIYLHAGGRTFVELFRGEVAEPAAGQSYQHVCLEVDDFEGTVEALRGKGVEISGVKVGNDRSKQAWLADPDGNRIELHGYMADSKQGPWLS
jgi:catechol 2,3-dioxygenase-like lactoylglutathione lyase family enzyme